MSSIVKLFSKEDCIKDLQQTANSYDGDSISRNYYREHGNITEHAWSKHFGTFPEFKRSAGLSLTRYQNKINLKTAQHASVDILREISKDRRNYGEVYVKCTTGRYKTIIVGSDFHDKEIDPFFLRVFHDTIARVDPDIVSLGGDIFDLPEFGKYKVDPREWDTVGRIKFGREQILKPIREAAPNAQIDLIEGNHEVRLFRHISESSPALREILSDLHGMNISHLFKLEEYGINYISKCDLFSFTDAQLRNEVHKKNYKVYYDTFMVHHHPEGKAYGMPGVNGHHHRYHASSEYSYPLGSYQWLQLGCGHKRDASYADGQKWNQGFVIVHIDTVTRRVNYEYISVGDTFAVVGGIMYERTMDEFYPMLTEELSRKVFA